VLAKTSGGRPIVSVCSTSSCSTAVVGPSQAKPLNINYATLPFPLRTLHTMQDCSVHVGFSAFCLFRIFVLGEKHYLVFCIQALRSSSLLLLLLQWLLSYHSTEMSLSVKALSAVHVSLPLLFCLSSCTVSLFCFILLPSTLCSPFTLPVTFCSWCISSEEPEVCY